MTLPPGLEFRRSSLKNVRLGVWTTQFFPSRTRFGPYEGDVIIGYGSFGPSAHSREVRTALPVFIYLYLPSNERDVAPWCDGSSDRSFVVDLRGKSVRSWCDGSSVRSFMVDPLRYFSFQPVLHDWCNKSRMYVG